MKKFVQHFDTLRRLQARADRECDESLRGKYNSWDLEASADRFLIIGENNKVISVFNCFGNALDYINKFIANPDYPDAIHDNIETLKDEDEFGNVNCTFRKVTPDGNSIICLEIIQVESYLERNSSIPLSEMKKIVDSYHILKLTDGDMVTLVNECVPFDIYFDVANVIGYEGRYDHQPYTIRRKVG